MTAKTLMLNRSKSRYEEKWSRRDRVIAIAPVVLVIVFLLTVPMSFVKDAAACYLILFIVPFVAGLFAGAFSDGAGAVTFSGGGGRSSSSESYSSSYASSS